MKVTCPEAPKKDLACSDWWGSSRGLCSGTHFENHGSNLCKYARANNCCFRPFAALFLLYWHLCPCPLRKLPFLHSTLYSDRSRHVCTSKLYLCCFVKNKVAKVPASLLMISALYCLLKLGRRIS